MRNQISKMKKDLENAKATVITNEQYGKNINETTFILDKIKQIATEKSKKPSILADRIITVESEIDELILALERLQS